MANRKGVVAVNKWATSDGQEFSSANEANDYQGALNEIDRDGGGFQSWFYSKNRNSAIPDHSFLDSETSDMITPEMLKAVLFSWEHYKNSHSARANDLFPEKESGVSEPGTGSEGAGLETAVSEDQEPSIAMENLPEGTIQDTDQSKIETSKTKSAK